MLTNLINNQQIILNTYIWCKTLEYIRKFIPIQDYKSCRDIFKILLEIIKKISQTSYSKLPDSNINVNNDTISDQIISENDSLIINDNKKLLSDTKLDELFEVIFKFINDFMQINKLIFLFYLDSKLYSRCKLLLFTTLFGNK